MQAPAVRPGVASKRVPGPPHQLSVLPAANRARSENPLITESSSAANRRALLLLAAGAAAVPVLPALSPLPASADDAPPGGTTRVFFDVSVDRKPAGRIVVEVDSSAARVGAQRFLDLVVGKEGVGYRRSKIELLQDGYIQDSGLKALSYKASGATAIAGGLTTEALEDELAASSRRHDTAGVVSVVVLSAEALPQKERLVAIRGQLVNVTEVLGESPNGTAFSITTRREPSLDKVNLVVGRVVEGMDVVASLAAQRRVKDNSDSPFFQAGKASGDKRAIVAERGFGRPFSRIVIEECGLL